jgi:hypothetical protein
MTINLCLLEDLKIRLNPHSSSKKMLLPEMVPKSKVKVGLPRPFMCIQCVSIQVGVSYDHGHSLSKHEKFSIFVLRQPICAAQTFLCGTNILLLICNPF